MKYEEMIKELRNKYMHGDNIVYINELLQMYIKIYENNNKKTFENMLALLKQYEVITDFADGGFMVLKNAVYKFDEVEKLNHLYKIIEKEFKEIKFIIWNTEILNEFTHHYVMKNYTIVEVEKFALDNVLMLLKEKFIKKYTIVTENMYIENRTLYLNDENILILKPLIARSPTEKDKEKKLKPTLEKIMVDIYKDKLYEQYQGKELERIYENIINKYSVNFKRLYSYAKERGDLEKYKSFIKKLNIDSIYKE